MVLFQPSMKMEAGIAIGEMLGVAGVEEEDAVTVVVEGEDTMGTRLICSKMVDTTKIYPLKAVVLNPYCFLFYFNCVWASSMYETLSSIFCFISIVLYHHLRLQDVF